MLPRGGFDAKASRERRCVTEATPDAIAALAHGDPAKALVLNDIALFVAGGYAECRRRDSGEIELRFDTGETFILADSVVVRVA
jgi:hypothetical protein